jgi:glycosyltransferase involved in cell wall biosynthesis
MAEPNSRPSLALVAHDIQPPGGMELVLAELILRINADYRVVVVASTLSPDLRPLVEWRRVRVPRRPFPLKFLVFALLAGWQLAREQVDLVHVTGAIVPNRANLATVHLCHAGFRDAVGMFTAPGTPFFRRLNTSVARRLALAAERWCYRRSRLRVLAAVSHGLARELECHYQQVPVVVTPNGVDMERFRPVASARTRRRREEGVCPDETLALFVGGDWDHKGLGIAIAGLARAKAQGVRLRLWVVGAGDQDRYRRLAGRLGVECYVRFFGPRMDTERFYQAADLLVLPSLYETFSLVAHEAAASRIPLVATPVHGSQELIGDDEAGLLVERTPEAVGDALARLGADTELRRRLGRVARRRASQYNWDRSVESVVALYHSLLADKTLRPAGEPA